MGAVFAALLGLAFGSFLNVLIARLPEGESIVSPGSHCRNCEHALAWWENLPVVSWIILRGRCKSCHTSISVRYPLIELATGILWLACWLRFSPELAGNSNPFRSLLQPLGYAVFCWLLVALAALDQEHFWLPDILTLPGIVLGVLFTLGIVWTRRSPYAHPISWLDEIWSRVVEILLAAGVVLIIRLAYWLVRRKEGIGLGDAKLMGMLAAWLGLIGALESFGLAVIGATVAAILWLSVLAIRRNLSQWSKMPLPLGTFLCLAALSEIFCPAWFWNWWSRTFLVF